MATCAYIIFIAADEAFCEAYGNVVRVIPQLEQKSAMFNAVDENEDSYLGDDPLKGGAKSV